VTSCRSASLLAAIILVLSPPFDGLFHEAVVPPRSSVAPCAQTTVAIQAPARDWMKFPSIVEIDTPEKIIALGDVHGDYDRLVNLLVAGKVLEAAPASPDKPKWIAKKAVFVCTGDMIDKGKHSIKVVSLFKALQVEAALAGGRVIVTMGNHEAEFLADPLGDHKAKEFRDDLGKRGVDPVDVANGKDSLGLGTFMRSLPFAARVSDWFFAHAGNTQGLSLTGLRAALEDGAKTQGFAADVLLNPNSILEARLHPTPWWEREGEKPKASRSRLESFASALGVKHFVVGHQQSKVRFSDGDERKKGEIYTKFDGLIFLIDVGMSHAIDDSEGVLLVIRGGDQPSATAVFPDGASDRIWPKP
jgi:Calcineurin-like phosphoesterase